MEWSRFDFEFRLNAPNLHRDLVLIEAYREAALNLVLPPDWREQLDKLNRVRVVHGTTALEGNPLSEDEISRQIALLDSPERAAQTRVTKEQHQIRNASLAQSWVRERFTPTSAPLRLDDLLRMHEMLTSGSDMDHNEPGRWRQFSVQVGSPDLGGVHVGAPYGGLPGLMARFVDFVNSRRLAEQNPVLRALIAHFFLVTIHPFGDGNGRVSRLLEAGILFQGGYNVHGFYGLSNYFYRNQRDYKLLLQRCRATQPFDVTPFVEFGVAGFAAELKGINNFIKTKLNRVVYREMLVRAFNRKVGKRRRLLNQREYRLLDFLLSETEPSDPFSDHPSKRIPLSYLRGADYVRGAYGRVTDRTFTRELDRLGREGFIKFARDEELDDWIVELDFAAIGKF